MPMIDWQTIQDGLRLAMPTSARFVLLVILSWLGGCTQWYYDLGDPLAQEVDESIVGDSLVNVFTALGPPMRMASTKSGWVMAWESWRIREDALGVSLGWVGADILTVDWGSAQVDGEFLLLTFDRENRVSGAARVRRDASLGSGAALQPFYSFVSVVSVDDLLQALPAHDWGGAQLLPLPSVLNNSGRPGMGDTGVEQRGTPLGAGARSQEWLE